MGGTCYRNSSNFEIFPKIVVALECIAKDRSQKGDTRREANNIANKMHELEFNFYVEYLE